MKVLITTSKHVASFQLSSLLTDDDVLFGDHFDDYPRTDSSSLAHEILKFCLDHQIEKVFPLKLEEARDLSISLVLFEEFGIEVMLGADELTELNASNKIVDSFSALSTGLIALGYPNQKIAIASADKRGGIIVIDDAVKDNLQIWNQVETINFTQLGRWFNQSNFQFIDLYPLSGDLSQYFVLIDGQNIQSCSNLNQNVSEAIRSVVQNKKCKGFYHIAICNQNILRIVNATL